MNLVMGNNKESGIFIKLFIVFKINIKRKVGGGDKTILLEGRMQGIKHVGTLL